MKSESMDHDALEFSRYECMFIERQRGGLVWTLQGSASVSPAERKA